ncbi:MAG: rod shape-determining protein RodA [bacterium]
MFLNFKKFDWISLFVTIMLLCMGLTMIYSTTASNSASTSGGLNDLSKQIIFILVGFILYFLFSMIDYKAFKGLNIIYLSVGFILLTSILFFGNMSDGARRWFDLGFIRIQPSEIAKILLIFFIADYLDKNQPTIRQFKHIVITLATSSIVFLLILLEPDLGTALVTVSITLIMLPISGIKIKHFFYTILASTLLFPLAWVSGLIKAYHWERLKALLDPSYQVQQAIIAVGSGGLLGRGIGFGTQTQLKFLPVRHTDFIFATIGEELGFLGISILLVLFGILLMKIITTAKRSNDNFGALIVIGIFSMFFFQIIVNIGMNMGVLPVTGITLPMISYGGSSMLVSLASLGIVQSVYMRGREIDHEEDSV